jgi:hypothetical protein
MHDGLLKAFQRLTFRLLARVWPAKLAIDWRLLQGRFHRLFQGLLTQRILQQAVGFLLVPFHPLKLLSDPFQYVIHVGHFDDELGARTDWGAGRDDERAERRRRKFKLRATNVLN